MAPLTHSELNQLSVHRQGSRGTVNRQGLADLMPAVISGNCTFFFWDGAQGCRQAAVACVGRAGNPMTSFRDDL